MKYGMDYLSDTSILGFTHEMAEVNNRELSQGRDISQT